MALDGFYQEYGNSKSLLDWLAEKTEEIILKIDEYNKMMEKANKANDAGDLWERDRIILKTFETLYLASQISGVDNYALWALLHGSLEVQTKITLAYYSKLFGADFTDPKWTANIVNPLDDFAKEWQPLRKEDV